MSKHARLTSWVISSMIGLHRPECRGSLLYFSHVLSITHVSLSPVLLSWTWQTVGLGSRAGELIQRRLPLHRSATCHIS